MRFLLAVLVAGCAVPAFAPEPFSFDTAIVMDHDHTDHGLHTAHHGLSSEAWSTLGVQLGENGFANFVLHQEGNRLLAFVAIDGDTRGGFVIADVTDPAQIRPLGSYWIAGSGIQEVRVTPDGKWAVMNVQAVPRQGDALGPSCTVCIHVVDVSNKAAPRFSSAFPVELLGSHNFDFETYADGEYLFFVSQSLYNPYPDPGNRITAARLVVQGTEATLVPVGSFDHNVQGQGRSFPHDVMVQEHPAGKIAYVSHWDGGHVLFDVDDPTAPRKLSVLADAAPSEALAVHWMMQEDRGEQVLAWSAPEIGGLASGTGVIRALDVTDPTAPKQLGAWQVPGDLSIEGRYIMSGHTAVPHPDRELLAVGHYHAGVWVLDTHDPTNPRHIAFYQPHGDEKDPYDGPIWWKKPNFSPDGYGPNVYQARWDPRDGDRIWVTDRGTGLYALRLG